MTFAANLFKHLPFRRKAAAASRTPTAMPAPLLLALEPRIVYDASAAAIGAAAAGAASAHPHHADAGAHRAAADWSTAERSATAQVQGEARAAHSDAQANASAAEKQVVFIDPNVTDYQALISGLPAGTTYVVLNQNSDGLAQIANWLEQHPGMEAVHLVTHGSEAQVEVGSIVLDSADLSVYSAELSAIGKAMAPGGDLLIYGCDVAEGSDGKMLVTQIAAATNLNVAASTDLTGSAALGGNWTLEYQVGDVKTPVIFSAQSEQQYDSLLTQTTEDFTNADDNGYDSGQVPSFTLDGITYTVTGTGAPYDNAVSTDSYLQALADETASSNALVFDAAGIGGVSAITIKMADGHPFSIQSLDFDGLADTNVTFVATLVNGQTTSFSIASNGNYVTQTVELSSTDSAFNEVASVTIEGGNLLADVGHIVYSELTPPTLTTTSGATTFTSVDSSTGTPVAVDPGLTVTDTEASTLATATVQITGNYHAGEDVLEFANTSSTTYGNIVVQSYNASTGTLTLTSSSATATTAQWQAALDAVTYTDTAATPNTSARTITFTASDSLATGTSATKTVDVDSPPIVTTSSGTTNYTSGTSATIVDSGVNVTDPSQGTQASATVTITSGFDTGHDTLSFTNASSTTYGNIQGTYSDGVLTLTSSGGSATDAQWTHALDAVTFSSTSSTYGDRTISFVANDGTDNSVAATKTVDVTNPDPVITTDLGSAAFVSGDNVASTPVTVDSGLTLTDPGTSTLASATIAITGNFHSDEDVLLFTNDGSTMGNISATYSAATGALTLTSVGASATLAQWRSALDSVTYTDTAVTPNTATRTMSFSVTDGNSNTSNTATRTVTVTDTDQTPIVSTTSGTTSYVGGTSAVTVDGGVTVSDLDNSTQASGTVSIGSGFASGDALSFSNTSGTQFGNIQASYDSSTGALTLTSLGASATNAQWANAFEAVAFSSTSTSYGNRTISFVANDGTVDSVAATKTVDVTNPAPVVTTDSGSAAFVAGDNVTSTPVAVDSGLTLKDPGTSTLASATVAITGNLHSGEDVLLFTNDGSTMGNISASYSLGVLTLTSASDSATLAQWQAAFEAVKYTDTQTTPNNLTRTISFSVTDGNGNTSNTATRTVTVADTDQTPIVTTTGGTTNYVGGTSAAIIDGGVTVSDLDNTTLSSGTVSITSGFHSGDTLSFTNTSSTQFANIQASYNASTGVMTLTSSGATASQTQWADAFAAVTFSAGASATPGSRTIAFVVNDGIENSAAATDTVDVLGPPTIVSDSGSVAFTAGDNVTSTPVTIDSGLTVTDGTAPTLASVTVAITGNFHSGEDVLAFTNTNSTTYGNIGASYSLGTGVLTLTSSGNSATLAQWQAALDAVTYTDTAVTPNPSTRTISFTAVDASSITSNTATRTVTVADTDQTPIITTMGSTINYVGGTAATTIGSGITVSDLDNATQSSATVSIGAGFQSGDSLGFTNFGAITGSYDSATGVLTLTSAGATATNAQWASALSSVTFSTTNTSYGNRTVSFAINDGTKTSAAAIETVDVLGPPQVTADVGSASFVAGDNATSTPVVIDSGLTLTDGASTTFSSATIAITGNFHSSEDVLSFTNDGATMGNIAASYNATTGLLTLTSSGAAATVAQWKSALDSVTYTDTAVTPNTATRTISFTAVDSGGNTSNTATRTVTVADTDQTPIVKTTSDTTDYRSGSTATTIGSGITVSDLDNATQSSATVSIGAGFQSGDTLSFTNTGATAFGDIRASYDATTGVLTLTSAGASTNAEWANALSAVTFSSTSTNYGDRTISFATSDGTKSSAAVTDTVDVTNAMVLAPATGTVSFVEGDNAAAAPVTVGPDLTLSDANTSATPASATIAITGNFHGGEDMLSFTNTNAATFGDLTGSYNAATGVLTLSSAGGKATVAQWQSALDAVTYTDTAMTPNAATRTISFTVADSNGDASNAVTRTVTVAATDQSPVVTTTGGTTRYVGGTPAMTIDAGIAVSDRDNATQQSATVSIGTGFQHGDVLGFSNTSATTFGNITASYDASTGVLTLTSAGAAATDAQWSHALSAVTFSSASTGQGSRAIAFSVNDGQKTSVSASDAVQVAAPAERNTSNGVVAAVPVGTTPDHTPQASPDTSPNAIGDAQSNTPSVLTEFDNPRPVGTVPSIPTMTFSDAGTPSSYMPGRTSVPPMPSLVPAGLSDSQATPADLPPTIEAPVTVPVDASGTGGAFTVDISSIDGDALADATDVSVSLADGKALPGWLRYDAANGTLSGAMPRGTQDVHVLVQVRDASGHVIRREIVLAPNDRGATGTSHMAAPHASREPAIGPAHDLVREASQRTRMPVGKPSLAHQFAAACATLHVARAAPALALAATSAEATHHETGSHA